MKASLVAQLVKNPPAMWETWVQSPDLEDPVEKGKAATPVLWPRKFHRLNSSIKYEINVRGTCGC